MPKPLQARLNNLKYKLQEAQPKLHENMLLRKRIAEKAYHDQMKIERDDISSRMKYLQPGARKVFFQMRLQKLNSQLKK